MTSAVSPPATLAGYPQPLAWSPAEAGDGTEYATVEVPVDYRRPAGDRLVIGVSRRRASVPARRRGALLAFTGGPGGNEGLGLEVARKFEGTPLPEVYDIIGFEPRGYGGSPQLFTEVTPRRAEFDSRPDDATFADIAADAREAEQGCLRAGGGLREHISTRNIARDMDVIRGALGEATISFVGYAYGSYLGAVYGTMFGSRLDRSVLDSCVHPDWLWRKQFMMQAVAIRRNVDAWSAWVAKRDHRFGLGRSAAQVLASVEAVAGELAAQPAGGITRTIFDEALGNGSALRPGWGELADLVTQLRAGPVDASATTAERFAWQGMRVRAGLTSKSEAKRDAKAGAWVVGGEGEPALRKAVIEAVTCEADWPTDLEVYYADMRRHRERYPYGFGVMRAQPWVGTFRTFTPPEPLTAIERVRYPAGLVVTADSDPLDPAEGAVAMAERLGHQLIVVTDDGGHELYPTAGNAAVNEHVERYLVEGLLPPEQMTTCPGSPRPDVEEGSQ